MRMLWMSSMTSGSVGTLFLLLSSSSSLMVTTSGFVIGGLLGQSNMSSSSTALGMAKKMRNKQAELAKKMAEAKKAQQQQEQQDQGLGVGTGTGSGTTMNDNEEKRLTDEEMKELNDRRRFEDMLQKQTASLNAVSSDGYLSREQEEAEIDAYQRGLDRKFEGDPAPTQPFEDLVHIKSGNALGDVGAKRLIPWMTMKKNTEPNNSPSDFLVIVCDPRIKSSEFQETATSMYAGLRKDILSKTIFINADTPAENRRWLKKSNLGDLNVYSDEKREWMRAYTALGEERWSMTLFVIANERIQIIAREMESMSAVKVINNAVTTMQNRRL